LSGPGCPVDLDLQGLSVQPFGMRFFGGKLVPKFGSCISAVVVVVTLEFFGGNLVSAHRGHTCVGRAAKNVGYAPNAKAERQQPQKYG